VSRPGVLLLGATGATGRRLLERALAREYRVTALVRDPRRLALEHANLRIVVGDATDPSAVREAVAGSEAAVSALGTRSPSSLVRCDLMTASMGVLVPAMEEAGAKRLILLSALGVGASANRSPRALRFAFRTLLRRVGADKARAEDRVRASELDWTIVYPPSLTDDEPSGELRAGEAPPLRGIPKISRADLADFMLAQLVDASYSRAGVIVTR
jgi:putative NADH-flavin reductase